MTIKEGQRYLCLGGECRCGCGTVYEPVSLIVTQVQLDQESFDGWVHSTVLDDNEEDLLKRLAENLIVAKPQKLAFCDDGGRLAESLKCMMGKQENEV